MFHPEPSEKKSFKSCPKTGRPIKQKHKKLWGLWLLPFTGLAALIWFLVRVIPKPSRATYPCQQVAFPLASGFIIWLTGTLGSIAAFRKAQNYLTKTRYVLAAMSVFIGIFFIWLIISNTAEELILAQPPRFLDVPIGVVMFIPVFGLITIIIGPVCRIRFMNPNNTSRINSFSRTNRDI